MSDVFQDPKDFAMAVAKIDAAQQELAVEYMVRKALLDDARLHVQRQWDRWQSAYDTWISDAQDQTAGSTTRRMRRSQKHELVARKRYPAPATDAVEKFSREVEELRRKNRKSSK